MEFKVGDRVRVYSFTGRVGNPPTGKVCSIDEEGHVEVQLDDIRGTAYYYPEQCRRLRPKKPSVAPEEVWINTFVTTNNSKSLNAYQDKASAEREAHMGYALPHEFCVKYRKVKD